MKAIYKIIPLILVAAALALAGCSIGGETAVIRVNLGQAGSAKAVSTGDLSHVIVFSGPTGSKTVNVPKGGGNVSVNVASGTWTITVTAYYGEQVYAVGFATADVKAGKSTSVSIQMTVVWTDTAGVPNKDADKRPLLSAQGFDLNIGCSDFLSLTTCAQGSTVWATAEPGTATVMLGTDDFTWEWNVGGTPVTAGVDPLYPSEYVVQPGNDHKKVTVTATHPDYQGSVTIGPVYVCQTVDSSTWGSAINAKPDGNFVLSPDTYSIGNVLLSSPFTGIFDGNGETITLNIMETLPGSYGLFAEIGGTGIAKNFNLDAKVEVNPSINNEQYNVGSVAGVNRGNIMNVSVVLNPFVIMRGYGASFNARTGGIVGYNAGGIKNCSVMGTSVQNEDSGVHLTGGIAGLNEGQISFCWINASVIGAVGTDGFFGGIAGQNSSSINNCVVLGGNITEPTPGIAGRIWSTGSGSGSGNYATIQVQLDGSSYTNPNPPLNDGTDVNYNILYPMPPDAGDEHWWYDGLWESVWWGGEETPWVWDSSGYPVLWF